ncbi:MAG TPA: DUF2683 family protein [Hanamia sp.]
METILIRPKSKDQIKVFEEMAKALKLSFEVKGDSPYNPEFASMVKQADKDFKNVGEKIKLDDIWK